MTKTADCYQNNTNTERRVVFPKQYNKSETKIMRHHHTEY